MANPKVSAGSDEHTHRRRPIALSWDRAATDIALRDTGISLLGRVPWGTHVCMFYDTKRDLLDANVAFFKAGIESRERVLWAVSDPISLDEAKHAARRSISNFDDLLATGDIEISSARDVYLSKGKIEPQKVIQGWHRKLRLAVATGREGLRISGNAFWQHTELWNAFCRYERKLDNSVAGHQLLVLCTYSLAESRARDVLEVAGAHQATIARRNGKWEFLKVPLAEKTKNEIRILNDDLSVLSRSFSNRELLTPREEVVLAQIVRGASNKEAARVLCVSPRTVEFHRHNIMQKLGTKNAADLVRKTLLRANDT